MDLRATPRMIRWQNSLQSCQVYLHCTLGITQKWKTRFHRCLCAVPHPAMTSSSSSCQTLQDLQASGTLSSTMHTELRIRISWLPSSGSANSQARHLMQATTVQHCLHISGSDISHECLAQQRRS